MAYVIGDARASDIMALLELESLFPSDWISRRQCLYHIQNPKAVFLVGRKKAGELPVGYALFLMRKGQCARFYSLIVHPSEQGRGLGRQLCQAGLDNLAKGGVPAVSLEVDRLDSRAIALYKSLGFTEMEIIKNYYEDHRDAVKMKKRMELE